MSLKAGPLTVHPEGSHIVECHFNAWTSTI